MDLEQRVGLMVRMGEYMLSADLEWKAAKEEAFYKNGWFTPSFIELAAWNIATSFLKEDLLMKWADAYQIPSQNTHPKTIGIVMAGNVPLVGFHDFLCGFITGHRQQVKLSSKDAVLLEHLVNRLFEWAPETKQLIGFSNLLKGCDAYIATGSNNSARYFEYYFGKFPHIIRRNRTSVAILRGDESAEELSLLADDIYQYFGLGCRNVTKLYVPEQYDFVPLLEAFKKYDHLSDHHKYKNNYDYQLAILIVNKKYYMTNGSIILVEDQQVFSPISRLNYEYSKDMNRLAESLTGNADIQAIVGKDYIPFGKAQQPALSDFADGVDTLAFFLKLGKD